MRGVSVKCDAVVDDVAELLQGQQIAARHRAREAGAAGDVGDGEAAAAVGGEGLDHGEAALRGPGRTPLPRIVRVAGPAAAMRLAGTAAGAAARAAGASVSAAARAGAAARSAGRRRRNLTWSPEAHSYVHENERMFAYRAVRERLFGIRAPMFAWRAGRAQAADRRPPRPPHRLAGRNRAGLASQEAVCSASRPLSSPWWQASFSRC